MADDAGCVRTSEIIAQIAAGEPVVIQMKLGGRMRANFDAQANVTGFDGPASADANVFLANGTARAAFPLSVTGEGYGFHSENPFSGMVQAAQDNAMRREDKRFFKVQIPGGLAAVNRQAIIAALRAIERSCSILQIQPVHHVMAEPMSGGPPPPGPAPPISSAEMQRILDDDLNV